MPDNDEFKARVGRAVRDGERPTLGWDSTPEDISTSFARMNAAVVEDAYRIGGKTFVVEDGTSADPDFKLVDDAYDIASPGKTWFVLSIAPTGVTPERVRRFVKRQGFLAYWPRRVCLRVRGRGSRRRKYAAVQSLFPRYVLVHLPAKGTLLSTMASRAEWLEMLRASEDERAAGFISWIEARQVNGLAEPPRLVGQPYQAPFGALTTHEGRFNGVGDWLANVTGPIAIDDVHIARIVERERAGEFDATSRKGKRRVSKLPEWMFCGALVMIKEGPFANFPALIEEIDDVRERLKASVSIFGRSTFIDLAFDQVCELC